MIPWVIEGHSSRNAGFDFNMASVFFGGFPRRFGRGNKGGGGGSRNGANYCGLVHSRGTYILGSQNALVFPIGFRCDFGRIPLVIWSASASEILEDS